MITSIVTSNGAENYAKINLLSKRKRKHKRNTYLRLSLQVKGNVKTRTFPSGRKTALQ